ncbi:DUF2391 family protein [Candidatus Woesearchaeota archaeon]|nr:DUF2391 family protein [Candidatus Woesearchaeota archaeon]
MANKKAVNGKVRKASSKAAAAGAVRKQPASPVSGKKRKQSVSPAVRKGVKHPDSSPDSSISEKLDEVLSGQKKLLEEEVRLAKEELGGEKKGVEIEEKEERLEQLGEKELSEIEKLEKIEKEVQKQVKQHPLTKVTLKDIYRGSLGAFIGIVLHYTVLYGVKIAESITMGRATIIYFLSFVVGMVFLYVTGFRKVKNSDAIKFLPVRMVVLYTVSIVISVGVLYLLFPTFGRSFEEAYKQIATVSLTAVIGACTADILGKD